MSDDKVNVQIKQIPGADGHPVHATTKVFIRAGTGRCRPLEPGEVVAIDKEEAFKLIQAIPMYIEITPNPANRPLYFDSVAEAEMTSQDFNPNTAGRAEEAKQAMAELMTKMADEKPNPNTVNDLASREEAIRQREIELGLRPAEGTSDLEAQLDADTSDYVPDPNNASSRDDIQKEIAGTESPETVSAPVEPPKPRQRSRRSAQGK